MRRGAGVATAALLAAVVGAAWWAARGAEGGTPEGAAGAGGADPRMEVHVAVASNFAAVHRALAERFTAETGVAVRTSVGSTGQLFAQIRNGAPFDLFLAADSARPGRLEAEGDAVAGTRATYALGRLALYSPGLPGGVAGPSRLREEGWRHLSVADPRTAPYGVAADEALAALGLGEAVAGRVVRGASIGQVYQQVTTGAAELGFVALAQVVDEPRSRFWTVPDTLHAPIVQQAVALEGGAAPAEALRYLAFLQADPARRVIGAAGYDLPPAPER